MKDLLNRETSAVLVILASAGYILMSDVIRETVAGMPIAERVTLLAIIGVILLAATTGNTGDSR